MNVWMMCLMTTLAVAATANAQPGGGRGGRGGMGGFGRGGLFMIAGNEAVQKDLGLSADDAAKVKAIADEFNAANREAMASGGQPNFQEMSQEDRTKFFEKMTEIGKTNTEKFLPKLKDLLTADQFTRLQQISWQTMGIAALSDADVVKAVAVSKDQQDKIKSINTEYDTKRNELFQGGGGGRPGPEMFEKMQEQNKEREAKITEVLTKDQQDKFASIKGKEFDVSQLNPFGRGGPGGGPGGGGPGGRPKRPQPKAE